MLNLREYIERGLLSCTSDTREDMREILERYDKENKDSELYDSFVAILGKRDAATRERIRGNLHFKDAIIEFGKQCAGQIKVVKATTGLSISTIRYFWEINPNTDKAFAIGEFLGPESCRNNLEVLGKILGFKVEWV